MRALVHVIRKCLCLLSQYVFSDLAGRIKEMLEAKLGIPAGKQELKGLIKRKVDDQVRLAQWLCSLE